MKAPREVNYEDVDDVIGIASELQELDADRLSVEELEAVAKDLEIPAQFVAPAVQELRRRRAAKLAKDEARQKRNRLVAYGVAAAVVLLLIWAIAAQSSLASDAGAIEAKRALITSVSEQRQRTIAIYQNQPESPEKKAALAGAENRVRTERMRYDTLVGAYNASVTSFPGSVWSAIFGLPDPFPSSDQLVW